MSRRPLIVSLLLGCALALSAFPILADSAINVGDDQCPDKTATQAEAASPAKASVKTEATVTVSHAAGDAGKSGKPRPRWQSFLPGMIR